MRTALIVNNGIPVNAIVIPDGADGDAMLSESCVEITGMHPQPGVGNGWAYANGKFVPPAPPLLTWDDIRRERDVLLADSDWTQILDAPVDQTAWAVYRQTLRDIPQTFATPDEVVWPEAP